MTPKNVRRAAVSALRAWSKGHDYAATLVERHARRNRLGADDRAFLNSILLAVLRNRRLLDYWIAQLRKGRLDHETRDVLRVGLCQLLILGIADHAAVNETVACARSPARGLVNAVLRRAIARRKRLLDLEGLNPAVRCSHPDWLWKAWRSRYGRDDAFALMEWNNQPAPVYFRVNPLAPHPPEGDREAVAGAAGFHTRADPIPDEWHHGGLVYVQDPSTVHAVELLDAKPGEHVLDACAAPGGKSALMAAGMRNEGEVLCTDANEKRLPRLEENLARLHVTMARVEHFDWAHPPPEAWHGRFDAILLDVPCSNTGVMRRRVDVRWRLRPEAIEELAGLQRRILENAVPCLKPGGRLVYSTCSVEPAENAGQIERFLQGHPDFRQTAVREILPFRDGFDGAWAARIE